MKFPGLLPKTCMLAAFFAGPFGLAWGEEPPAAAAIDPSVARDVEQAIAALDDEDFAQRGKAAACLEQWADDPELRGFLSAQLARVLNAPGVSVEVRSRLESLAKRLPAATAPPAVADPGADQAAALLDQLDSDSSAARESARSRLRQMLSHVELISPLWLELKRRACDPALAAATRRELEPLLDEARGAWLAADPADVPLPQISDEQIEHWSDDLLRMDESTAKDRFRRQFSERELLDGMARDEVRPRVLKILARKIAAAEDAASRTTLEQIVDFSKPALAAEVWGHELGNWEHRQHATVQYLLVGLPQLNEMARRPTHFDRIDEETAHCVSGNSLKEGDYPVRLAIPHPETNQELMFYLVNLPTARRRLAYEYQVRRDESLRLREISQRTFDDILSRQRVLEETEVLMLAQLDQHAASRFVGRYFEAVPDHPLVTSLNELNGESTVYRGLCHMMARLGTRDAVPALEQLARSGRLNPTIESPFHIAWVAALAIAQREPWPGVDDWLAQLVDEKTALVASGEVRPELGASAAALLVDRHGASTRPFGLETAGESATERLRFVGYRFNSEANRDDVKRWWEKQRAAAADRLAP
jgi:hypothetical protein